MLPVVTHQVAQPAASLKNQIETYVYKRWANCWQQAIGASHTKHFYFSPQKHKARYVYKLARLELGRFVRIVTGHNNLNSFQTKIGLFNNPCCRLCGSNCENFIHFINDCPPLRQRRTEIFLDQIPCNDMAWSVRMLLDFSYTPTIDDALTGTWPYGNVADVDTVDDPDAYDTSEAE